jgi:hypothetical protein
LGGGLIDMAHLGRQHIESTRFAKGVKNLPKRASYTSGRFMITTRPDCDVIGPGWMGVLPGMLLGAINLSRTSW